MAKWTENTTVKFVEEYLCHEVLWNFRSPNYKNKQAKQQAINEIVAAMAIPDFGFKEVELKIKNIRSTYSQESKKIKNSTASGSGGDDRYKSNLKWFNMLDEALKSVNIAEIRNTQNNMENKEEDGEENTEVNTEITEFVTTKMAGRKRKVNDLNLLVNKLDNVNKAFNAPKSAEHEFDLFGKSVAGQLKVMRLLQAVEAQQFIQNYLSQVRITHLMNSSRASPLQSNVPYSHTPSPSTRSYAPSPPPISCTLTPANLPPSPAPINRRYSYTPSPSTSSYAPSPPSISCPPTPINNYTNQPPSPAPTNRRYSYIPSPSTSTNESYAPAISYTPTPINYTYQPTSPNNTNQLITRPPTPQETITIYADSDDILAQALASIKP